MDKIPNKYILVYGVETYKNRWHNGDGDIRDDAIVFVVDETNGNAIYTHGYKFGGGSQNNESQLGGSSRPTDTTTDDDQEIKVVKYGWSTKSSNLIASSDASSILTDTKNIGTGAILAQTTPQSGNSYYFCFQIPKSYEIYSLLLNGAQPINYSICTPLCSESSNCYISNTAVTGGITYKININLVKS